MLDDTDFTDQRVLVVGGSSGSGSAVAPGLVDTELTKVSTANPKRREGTLASIPQRRLGTPADMAGAVRLLASPPGACLAGQTIVCDGGLSLAR